MVLLDTEQTNLRDERMKDVGKSAALTLHQIAAGTSASQPSHTKRQAEACVDEPASKKAKMEGIKDLYSYRVSIFFKYNCIRFVPQTDAERKCLRIYSGDIIANEMIKETEEHENDAESKIFKINAIKQFRLKFKNQQSLNSYIALKDKIFERNVKESMKFLESSNAKCVGDYVPEEHRAEWKLAEESFIKRFYFWKSFRTSSPQFAFAAFMDSNYKKLWNVLLDAAGEDLFLAPRMRILEPPSIDGGRTLNREVLEQEVAKVIKERKLQDLADSLQAEIDVYAAYGLTPHKRF